jgi:hypothetical protein
MAQVGGQSCEHSNEFSGSIQSREFLEWLSVQQMSLSQHQLNENHQQLKMQLRNPLTKYMALYIDNLKFI